MRFSVFLLPLEPAPPEGGNVGYPLHERRRDAHARVVAALERLHAERLSKHVERLAHHAFRGEVWDKAVMYLRRAGLKAIVRSAHREAIANLEQALTSLSRWPDTRERVVLAIDLRLDLALALVQSARYGHVLDRMVEAAPLAESLDDRVRLGQVRARSPVPPPPARVAPSAHEGRRG